MGKWASVLLVLLSAAVCLPSRISVHIILPDEQPRTSAEQNRPSADQLDGKDVIVRLYNNWRKDPSAFEKVAVNMTGYRFEIDSNEIGKNAIAVILAQDQPDPAVKSLLGNFIFARRYADIKGRSTSLYFSPRSVPMESSWTFTDPLGWPIPNAQVEILLYEYKGPVISLGKFVLDQEGRLSRLIPEVRNLRNFRFYLTHPQYGTAKIDRIMSDPSRILTPLVQAGSEAAMRAVTGVILDPQNNPVPGASIRCTSVRTLGEGLINPTGDCNYEVLSDQAGRFRSYLPNENTKGERGELIPPKSTYHFQIHAPKALGLLPYTGSAVNGLLTTIVMESAGYPRTFVFEDENGPITAPDILKQIQIKVERPDKPPLNFGYDEWKSGGLFPTGTYKPAVWGGKSEYEFKPMEVTSDSPPRLVFKVADYIHYYGQIVHGLTGEPMPGAFVIGMWSSAKGNLSQLTAEQWQALHALPVDPCDNDPALKPVRKFYGFKKIVRTDHNGRFNISSRPGRDLFGFVAFEENFLALKHRKHRLKPDRNNFAEVPTMKLYPAAKILIEPWLEEKYVSVCPRWLIDKKDNPPWVSDFLATDDRSETLFEYNKWLIQNTLQTFHVPAGLNLRVRLDAPYDRQWSPVKIPQTIHLEQGQVLDLGRVTFEPALEVFVKVIDSMGQPVEAAPVRILRDETTVWSVSHNSNEQGISRFFVSPFSQGQFGVSHHEGGLHLTETVPYQIAGAQDNGCQFTLQLSDEMLYNLFK